MHLKRKHPNFLEINNADEEGNADCYMQNENEECMETDNDNEVDTKAVDAQYLLRLRSGFHLSQFAVSEVILSTRALFTERLDLIKDRLFQALPNNIVNTIDIDELFQERLFDNLETDYLQEKYFTENFGYVKPVPIKLGVIKKQVKSQGRYQYVQREAYGYCVPFVKQLEQLLSMKEVQACLEEEVPVTNTMKDFFDGSFMRNQFFQRHPDALLFALYFDDFEIANPIGAHKKKHKLSIFYWSLLNISPEFRFKVQVTQLLGVAKTSHLKKFGIDKILSDFIGSICKLNLGCNIQVGNQQKHMFGTLLCVLGDTLAAQLIGGFKEGVGLAENPCRTCEITHDEIGESLHGNQFPLRNLQEHVDRCDYLEELNKGGKKYWSRKYGVTYRSPLLQIPEFDVTKCILHDPMHILLEGVVKMELQLLLSEVIYKKNYFSLKDLNAAILNFNYTSSELTDKPQKIEKKSLDRKNVLPMTAIEIKKIYGPSTIYDWGLDS